MYMESTKKLSVKDLATIGIFSAIMIVVFIAFSIVTGINFFVINEIYHKVFVYDKL